MLSLRAAELFVLAALPVVFFPGPSVAFIVTSSLRHGAGFGVRATAGVETGYLVHVLAAVAGVSALLATSAVAFSLVKVAGALYLVWLAIGAWRSSRSADEEPVIADLRGRNAIGRGPFRQGLVVGALNPKTAIFFLAFLPQFADPARGQIGIQVLLLGLLFILLACVPDLSWAVGAGKLRPRLARLRRKVVERASAVVYTVLAAGVLTLNRASS
jgi:threonine/homoserine/homoserine lactone efflux protein